RAELALRVQHQVAHGEDHGTIVALRRRHPAAQALDAVLVECGDLNLGAAEVDPDPHHRWLSMKAPAARQSAALWCACAQGGSSPFSRSSPTRWMRITSGA